MGGTTQTQVNLDTSVLLNYVFSNLPGELEQDRGSQRMIDNAAFYTVIGGKARQEFDALCNRRFDLYEDIIEYLAKNDSEIFDYDPRNRDVWTTSNDNDHLRSALQMGWHDKSKREQISTLRRCFQDLELYQVQVPHDLVDRCFSQQSNGPLLDRFEEELAIGHDCEILVDAVEISRLHSIEHLVAVDSDITDEDNIELILAIIQEVIGSSDILRISHPDGIDDNSEDG